MTIGEYLVLIVVCIGVGAYLLDKFSRKRVSADYMVTAHKDVDDSTQYDTESVAWDVFHELLEKTQAGKIKWSYLYVAAPPGKLISGYNNRIYSAVKNRVKIVVDKADITLDGTVMCNAWNVPNER
jgi:hypothetical protein